MITPLVLAGVGVQRWRRARSGGARDQPQIVPVWRPVSAAAATRVAALAQYERVVERFARRSLVLFAGTTLGALVNPAFTVVTVPFLVVHALPLFREGYLELRSGKLGGGTVRALAGGGMLLTRAFWVLSLSGALSGYIDKLQVRAWRRAEHRLGRVFGELRGTARVLRGAVDGADGAGEVDVALEDLMAGDLVVVSEGQTIPADGRIERGEARIDQRALTGEAVPVAAVAGHSVLAASVVRSGRIAIRVERAGAATLVASLDEMLNRAADHRAVIERLGDIIAERSVAPTLALAALAQVLLGASASICTLAVYPGDGIRMVMQLSLLHYLRHAAEQRILIKDGRVLEVLPAIDTVVFDATSAVLDELARNASDGGEPLVAALRARGLAIVLLCGDRPDDTERLARRIAIDRVVAGSSPADKAEQIRAWRAQGQRICVVGDGIAGAGVLRAGEVSVSLAGMATAADDAASVVLLDGGLARLPRVFDLAKDLTSNLRHNLLAQLAPAPILAAGIFLLGFRTAATLVLTSAGALIATANATLIAERRQAALSDRAPAPAARPEDADAEAQLGRALATAAHTVKRGFRRVLGSLDHRLASALTALGRASERIAVIDNES